MPYEAIGAPIPDLLLSTAMKVLLASSIRLFFSLFDSFR